MVDLNGPIKILEINMESFFTWMRNTNNPNNSLKIAKYSGVSCVPVT